RTGLYVREPEARQKFRQRRERRMKRRIAGKHADDEVEIGTKRMKEAGQRAGVPERDLRVGRRSGPVSADGASCRLLRSRTFLPGRYQAETVPPPGGRAASPGPGQATAQVGERVVQTPLRRCIQNEPTDHRLQGSLLFI